DAVGGPSAERVRLRALPLHLAADRDDRSTGPAADALRVGARRADADVRDGLPPLGRGFSGPILSTPARRIAPPHLQRDGARAVPPAGPSTQGLGRASLVGCQLSRIRAVLRLCAERRPTVRARRWYRSGRSRRRRRQLP